MVEQSEVGIARRAVDGAPILEYEDMLKGKSSKLFRSQCLRLGREEIPKGRRLPNGSVLQIHSIGGLEGQHAFRPVVHRYACFQPVPAAMLW